MAIHVNCYKVLHPGLPNGGAWFYEDFHGAFQYATGQCLEDVDDPDEAIEESEATFTCFGWSV